ncbi:unnamed protein product [Rotaria socialis]|uniref:Uncharacterized protein n=2 Tax=Rotaria socialis TaxID=392032 RepID=A0A818RBC5_9BILA|nr:unnamed protein product [Rotaria socialis]
MNNLLYLRSACFQLGDPIMHSGLRDFLLNLINNCHSAEQSSSLIKPRHSLRITDPRISELFSCTTKFYSIVCIGRVRFTASNYCRDKHVDDSTILYRADNEIHFGRIHRIVTVDGGDILLQIFSLASSFYFDCDTDDEQYEYEAIEMGMTSSGTTTCIIKANQIIEKCVFYLQSNNYATFIRFQNLVESS